jgi:hypothetical protein
VPGLVCHNDEACVRPSYCLIGSVGCQCTWAGDCTASANATCNRAANVCERNSNVGCAGRLGCRCLRAPLPDDVSGGCEEPAICIGGLCALPTRTDTVHGGEPGDPCDPCDGSCWLGFSCLMSVSRCVACVGNAGCPCTRDGKCERDDLVCKPHTFRGNNATALLGLNNNVWAYSVQLTPERMTVRAQSRQAFRFELLQKLANKGTLPVRDADLMVVHARRLHVIVTLDGAPLSDTAFWHIHPDEFGPFASHVLQVRFPRAGLYAFSFDFMHMVDGLMRTASVTKLVAVEAALDGAADDGSAAELGSLTSSAAATSDDDDDDNKWSQTFAALPFDASNGSDAFKRLLTPLGAIPDEFVRVPVQLELDRKRPHAGSCQLVKLTVGSGRHGSSSLAVFLEAPMHLALMLTSMPRDEPFLIHAHGHTSEEMARALGCRQSHTSYSGKPRFGPTLYAMLPFPLAGTWRLVSQMRFVLPDGSDALLTGAFEIVVDPADAADAAAQSKDRVDAGMCVFRDSALLDDKDDGVIDAADILERHRLWQAMHAGGFRVHWRGQVQLTVLAGFLFIAASYAVRRYLRRGARTRAVEF